MTGLISTCHTLKPLILLGFIISMTSMTGLYYNFIYGRVKNIYEIYVHVIYVYITIGGKPVIPVIF
jgi:hypothetical protein